MNTGTAPALWLIVASLGSLIPFAPGLEISAPDGLIQSRCIPASVEGNVVSFAWSEVVEDESSAMVRIYVGSGGLSGVNLCRPLDSKLCGLSQSDVGIAIDGMCPLNGSASINLKDGLHVIHLLVSNQDGQPIGAHETILLQVNDTFWMFGQRSIKVNFVLREHRYWVDELDPHWTSKKPKPICVSSVTQTTLSNLLNSASG